MKKSMWWVLLSCIFLTTTCSGKPKQFENLLTAVTDPNHRYTAEGISFLPPLGNAWEMVTYETTGSLGFYSYQNNIRNLHVDLSPFYFRLSAGDFNNFIQEKKEQARQAQAKIDAGTYGKAGMRFYKSEVVTKGEMRCVTEEVLRQFPVETKNYDIKYYCIEPNHPADFPPIQIAFFQSSAANLSLLDPDTILAPIWNSIQFKPVDRATSIAYKNWKVKNAQFRENMRRNDERERLRNAAKP